MIELHISLFYYLDCIETANTVTNQIMSMYKYWTDTGPDSNNETRF